MTFKRIALLFALSALLWSTVNWDVAFARQGEKTKEQEEAQKAQQELERSALILLDRVITDSGALKLLENRLMVQSRAATRLWPRDEKRARLLFKEVMNGLAESASHINSNDPEYYQQIEPIIRLRQETLQTLSQLDVELALEFLRATRIPPPPQNDYEETFSYESQLEMSLVAQVAAKDPDRALRLAKESLKNGINSDVLGPLHQIRAKDSKLASKLAGEIIDKLRSEDILKNQWAMNTAMGLLTFIKSQQAASSGEGQNKTVANDQPPLVDTAGFKELMDLVSSAILNAPAPDYINYSSGNRAQMQVMILQQIIPEMEKYDPRRAALLSKKLETLSESIGRVEELSEYRVLMQQDSPVESLLEAADRAPARFRNSLYNRAAWKALNDDDFERARQIVKDHMPDSRARDDMLMGLNQQEASKMAEKGKLEEARQLAWQIERPERRASTLAQLAVTAKEKADKKLALEILNDALALVVGRLQNYEQLGVRLQVAQLCQQLDPARSFDLIEMTIDRLNELLAAAEVIEGFDIQGVFREGEFRLQAGSNLSQVIIQCAGQLAQLARADFERALSASERFQRQEVRLMARLFIAEGALADQPSSQYPVVTGRGWNGRRLSRVQ